MRAFVRFLTTTAIGGITFFLPLVFVAVLFNHAIRLMHPIVAPVAAAFPAQTFETRAIATLISIIAIIVISLLAGIVARTRLARYIKEAIERRVEQRMPLYRIIRGAIQGFSKTEANSDVVPVLARFDDAWQLGFILEEHGDGMHTVFVPQAPTPMVGTVYYMNEARLKRLNITVGQTFRCIAQMGVGSRELLRQQT